MGLHRDFIEVLRHSDDTAYTTKEVTDALEKASANEKAIEAERIARIGADNYLSNRLDIVEADGFVDKDRLATDCVSTEKIVDGAITTDKLGVSAVTTERIADGAVDTYKLGTWAVTNEKIGLEAVSEDKIGTQQVTTSRIRDYNITTEKIKNGAVTEDKLDTNSVSSSKIHSGAINLNHLSNEILDILQPNERIDDLEKVIFQLQNFDTTIECVFPNNIPNLSFTGEQKYDGEYITVIPPVPTIKVNGIETVISNDIQAINIPTSQTSYILYSYDKELNYISASYVSESRKATISDIGDWSFTIFVYDNIQFEFKVGDPDYNVLVGYGSAFDNSNVNIVESNAVVKFSNITTHLGSLNDLKTESKDCIIGAINSNKDKIDELSSLCGATGKYIGNIVTVNMTSYNFVTDSQTATSSINIICDTSIEKNDNNFYILVDNCGALNKLNETAGGTFTSCLIGDTIDLCDGQEMSGSSLEVILGKILSENNTIHWNGSGWDNINKTDISVSIDKRVENVEIRLTEFETSIDDLKDDLNDIDKSVIALKDGVFTYPLHFEIGLIDTNGLDVENTGWYRTGFIPYDVNILQDMVAVSELKAIYFGYDADKKLINRAYHVFSGTKAITGISNAVYVRFCVDTPNVDKFSVVMRKKFAFDTDLNAVAKNVNEVSNLVDVHANAAFCNISALISASSEKCIHHDNFSRTMEGYEIGKNSEGELTNNSYSRVGGADHDDGLRVDNQCLFNKSTNSQNFTLRRIEAKHSDNYMVETNLPASNEWMTIGNSATDNLNFEGIFISKSPTYYSFFLRKLVKGSFVNIKELKYYTNYANILRIYYSGLYAHVFVNDVYVGCLKVSSSDGYVYIGAYKSKDARYEFINVFDLVTPMIHDTSYYIDTNVQDVPNSVISANANRYSLDAEITRFSNRSEKFELYSTDEKISNGRRTERSLVALLPNNLRTMRYSFDVYFPSSVGFDTNSSSYADVFFQLHDRQDLNVSRGKVPFHIGVRGDKICVTVYSSDRQASETLIEQVDGYELMTVPTDKWTHFDIFVRERYEERQCPFISIDVDGKRVFECRKPNCPNDVKGSSAQYGEYKNNWGVITSSIRYFDNFKVTY